MEPFPLPADVAGLHDDVIGFASAIQNTIAGRGGCQTMASEALNILSYNAVLAHRGVRSLCESGWTPLTAILNRTLLDVLANCIAVTSVPADSDYMGFKYISEFYRKMLADPSIPDRERAEVIAALDLWTTKVGAPDQTRARDLIREARPRNYWFQPEYNTPADLLRLSRHDIYPIYKLLSGPTHGGMATKLLFDDYQGQENIDPRPHPRNSRKASMTSSRLLMEVCYIRDQWDTAGTGEDTYKGLVGRLIAMRDF